MKRRNHLEIYLLLLFLVLVPLMGAYVSEAREEYHTVTALYDGVNLYQEPNKDSKNIACKMAKEEDAQIIERHSLRWWKVRYWGEELYVYNMSIKNSHQKIEKAERYRAEGEVVAQYTEFRRTPTAENKDNIICDVVQGETVEVTALCNGWIEAIYNGEKGFFVGESIQIKLQLKEEAEEFIYRNVEWRKYVIDSNRYNWGFHFSSRDEFKVFTEKLQRELEFAGYYIEVSNGNEENPYWKLQVEVLEEMKVPYGLSFGTSATTQKQAQRDYLVFSEATGELKMEYNKFPPMVNLLSRENQREVLQYLNYSSIGDYIVHDCAWDVLDFGYYELAPEFWIAHHELTDMPAWGKGYIDYLSDDSLYRKLNMENLAIWQFTDAGHQKIAATNLNMNIVADWWFEKYTKEG